MRLAFISYEFPPETLGGIATYSLHTVTMLVQRGHDVSVFSATAGPNSREEEFHGARVFRLPCSDRKNFFAVAVPALAAAHQGAAFDAAEVPELYAEGFGLRAAVPALPFILRTHTPLYIPTEIDFRALGSLARGFFALRRLVGGLVHRQNWAKIFREACARASFRHFYSASADPERTVALEADLVVPPSRRLAQRLRTDWALPEERLRVLPYAHAPAPDLLALSPPRAARTIGFHGGIRYFKGVHVLAEAMPLILARHPDVRFVLAGTSGASPVADGSFAAWRADQMITWRDTAEWLRPRFAALGDRVTLSGFVRPENLVTHLAAADVCVFPSLFDNFPSACLEAMSAARPVVATRSGGMEEMLGDDAGLLVPPGDAAALAGAICRLIENPALRTHLALRARARVLSDYAPAVIGPRHEALYAEAIALRRAA